MIRETIGREREKGWEGNETMRYDTNKQVPYMIFSFHTHKHSVLGPLSSSRILPHVHGLLAVVYGSAGGV